MINISAHYQFDNDFNVRVSRLKTISTDDIYSLQISGKYNDTFSFLRREQLTKLRDVINEYLMNANSESQSESESD